MTTRSKSDIFKPKVPLSLTISTPASFHIPRTYCEAVIQIGAMLCSMNILVLLRMKRGILFPHSTNVIYGKWIFRHKFNLDGSLDRYKARWVACGFHQQLSIDFDEIFNPVVKSTTVRTVLTIAFPRAGLFTISMSQTSFYMVRCLSRFSVSSLLDFSIIPTHIMFVTSKRRLLVCKFSHAIVRIEQVVKMTQES